MDNVGSNIKLLKTSSQHANESSRHVLAQGVNAFITSQMIEFHDKTQKDSRNYLV